MSGEVEWCPILHVRPKFDVFTLIPGLFMNFFNTDALSGACAGSLLEKIPYAEEKKSGVWDSISRPLPR